MPNKKPKEKIGYVYFLQMGEDGPIKIGFSQDVCERVASLQTNQPFPLRLIGVEIGSFATEKALHRRFLVYQTRPNSEWFFPKPELLEYIGKLNPDNLKPFLTEDLVRAPKTRKPKPQPKAKEKPIISDTFYAKGIREHMARAGLTDEELISAANIRTSDYYKVMNAKPGFMQVPFTMEETRRIGAALGVRFVTCKDLRPDHPPMPEHEFSCRKLIELLKAHGETIFDLLREVDPRLFLVYDAKEVELRRMFVRPPKEDVEPDGGVYAPYITVRKLTFDDVQYLGFQLNVAFY